MAEWKDFVKSSQSIVFGGGPPIAGEWGGDFSIPRQNPVKSLAMAGEILNTGTGELGKYLGGKIGMEPEWGERTGKLVGAFTPVFGTAMIGLGTVDNIHNSKYKNLSKDVATSRLALKHFLPKPVVLGGYLASKAFNRMRKAFGS